MPAQPIEKRVSFVPRDLPGFLDMLRYDQCTVIDWTHDKDDRYHVMLRGKADKSRLYQFTTDRWASFGLHLQDPR